MFNMKFEIPHFLRKEKVKTPELTAFAQYLLDHEEIKDQVFVYLEQLKIISQQPDTTLTDRRDLILIESALSDMIADAGVVLPQGVSANKFAAELQNRIEEGDTYVPVWQREAADTEKGLDTMQIRTPEDFLALCKENDLVHSLVQKFYKEEVNYQKLYQELADAGYELFEDFEEYLNQSKRLAA